MVAARMLFDLIDDESLLDGTPQEIVLLPKLNVRNSMRQPQTDQYAV